MKDSIPEKRSHLIAEIRRLVQSEFTVPSEFAHDARVFWSILRSNEAVLSPDWHRVSES